MTQRFNTPTNLGPFASLYFLGKDCGFYLGVVGVAGLCSQVGFSLSSEDKKCDLQLSFSDFVQMECSTTVIEALSFCHDRPVKFALSGFGHLKFSDRFLQKLGVKDQLTNELLQNLVTFILSIFNRKLGIDQPLVIEGFDTALKDAGYSFLFSAETEQKHWQAMFQLKTAEHTTMLKYAELLGKDVAASVDKADLSPSRTLN